jgi:hypothetical protein
MPLAVALLMWFRHKEPRRWWRRLLHVRFSLHPGCRPVRHRGLCRPLHRRITHLASIVQPPGLAQLTARPSGWCTWPMQAACTRLCGITSNTSTSCSLPYGSSPKEGVVRCWDHAILLYGPTARRCRSSHACRQGSSMASMLRLHASSPAQPARMTDDATSLPLCSGSVRRKKKDGVWTGHGLRLDGPGSCVTQVKIIKKNI